MAARKPKAEMIDVAIIGAGASASVYAAVLAEAGLSVTVLEAGPPRQLSDLYSSQIWARRLKWASPHVEETTRDTMAYNFNAGRGFGGAALHHFGVWPRYHPEDFNIRSAHDRGLDWPIDYDDLRPYYDRVQADVGVAGDAEAEIWRPAADPYPLPPVPRFRQGELLARGFEAMDMNVAPVPVAVLTRPYRGRPACIWDGWCDAGCPTGALANPLVLYLQRARQAGAELQANSHVTRLLTNARGDRVTAIEYVDEQSEVQELRARSFVLAAFTIENSRILLNSANDKHPDGLANGSGSLGRYLMSHPAANLFGMFDEPVQNHMGLSGGQIINQDRFAKPGDGDAFGSRQYIGGLALKPNDLLGISMSRADLFGPELNTFMQKASQNMAAMVTICEDEPQAENRIELSSNKDEHGYPRARITYNTSKSGMAVLAEAIDEGLAVIKASGAREAWPGPKVAQHIMGGTIMGKDAASSVTNRFSQTHELDNLFVGGPSVFPTSSCVNSTFTVHAASLMSAEYLRDNLAAL